MCVCVLFILFVARNYKYLLTTLMFMGRIRFEDKCLEYNLKEEILLLLFSFFGNCFLEYWLPWSFVDSASCFVVDVLASQNGLGGVLNIFTIFEIYVYWELEEDRIRSWGKNKLYVIIMLRHLSFIFYIATNLNGDTEWTVVPPHYFSIPYQLITPYNFYFVYLLFNLCFVYLRLI